MPTIVRPDPSEYPARYRKYVDLVPDGDILETLLDQVEDNVALVGLREEETLVRCAPGKWNAKEIIGHVIDTERVFTCRALRIGRGDQTPQPGFKQDDYVTTGGFADRTFASLLDEHLIVRKATVALFRGFPTEVFVRTGFIHGDPISVRAIAWIITGHGRYHAAIIREQYVPREPGI
jgi:hypothetical protein